MNWNSEFTSQWETFLNTVETRIRREIEGNGHLDSGAANAMLEGEIAKWSMNDHYNGAWLRKLTRQYPSLGEQFQLSLEKIQLDKSTSFESKMPIVEVLVFVGLIVITFVITYWQNYSISQQIVVTIAMALLMIPVLMTLRTKRKKKRIDAYVEQIREELERMGERLKSIVISTEQSTP